MASVTPEEPQAADAENGVGSLQNASEALNDEENANISAEEGGDPSGDLAVPAEPAESSSPRNGPEQVKRWMDKISNCEKKTWAKERQGIGTAMGPQVCSNRSTAPTMKMTRAPTNRMPEPEKVILVKKRNPPPAVAPNPDPVSGGPSASGTAGASSSMADCNMRGGSVASGETGTKKASADGRVIGADKYVPWTAYRGIGENGTGVLRGWGHGKRFLTDRSSTSMAHRAATHSIVRSTGASPFSAVYPYEEAKMDPLLPSVPSQSVQSVASIPEEIAEESAELSALKLPKARQLGPQASPDYNQLQIKYTQKPSHSFGSACLGHRFKKGQEFSRKAPCRSNGRQLGYRELRDQLPPGMPPKPPAPEPRPNGSVIATATSSAAAAAAAAVGS